MSSLRLDGIKHYYLFLVEKHSRQGIRELLCVLRHVFDFVESVYEVKRPEMSETTCPNGAFRDSVIGVAHGLQQEDNDVLQCFSETVIERTNLIRELEIQLGRTPLHAEAGSIRRLHNACVNRSSFVVDEGTNSIHIVCPKYVSYGMHPSEHPHFVIDGSLEAERLFEAAKRVQLFYLNIADSLAHLLR